MQQDQPTQQPQQDNKFILYRPSVEHDMMMVAAYARMAGGGELYSVLPLGSLSSFFISIHPPTELLFRVNEMGQPWFAIWFEKNMLFGTMMALWIDKSMRHTKEAVNSVIEGIGFGLDRHEELIAVTAHEEIVDQAKQLGYIDVGSVTRVKGNTQYILYLARKKVS